MSKVLSDYQTKLDQVLQDLDEELDADFTGSRAAFLQEAINTHAQNRPRIQVISVAGTGAFIYDLPPGWEEGFSAVEAIEYPAGQQVPVFMDQTRYMLYQGVDGVQLRFLDASPELAEPFLLTYTTRHTVAVGDEVPPVATTIPDSDFDAVCNLAGSLCCFAMGRKFTEMAGGASMAVRDQTWRSVLRYSEKGNELKALYDSHIGAHQNTPAASAYGTAWAYGRRRVL
jgi:hypothetical protein